MSRNWSAQDYHKRDSVDATLNALAETNYDGQFRMEKFVGYGELPDILCSAAEEAGRMVLGFKFKEVARWKGGPKPHAFISRPRRDTRDRGAGEVAIEFDVIAMLNWNWWSDVDRHNAAFKVVFNHMKSRVISRYPDAQCYMTHDMSGGYNFRVVVEPALPYGMAA